MTAARVHITELRSERLTLRAPRLEDLPAYAAFAASDRSHFVGGPYSAARAAEKLRAMIGQWNQLGYGRFVLEHNGKPIGHAGLLLDPDQPAPELTWTLWDSVATGQGLMTEAMALVQDDAASRGFTSVVSRVAIDNKASRAMAERIGGVLVAHAAFSDGRPCALYSHQLSENSALPTLRTKRLTLRPPRPGDLEPFAATMTPDRMTYLHDAAPDRAGAARILTVFAGMAVLRGFGPMIWERDGTPIGHGGVFWGLDADTPELGWVIWRGADESQGFATEAMQALIQDASARADLSKLWAGIHPDNARSHALAARLGLVRTDETRPDGDVIYRRHA